MRQRSTPAVARSVFASHTAWKGGNHMPALARQRLSRWKMRTVRAGASGSLDTTIRRTASMKELHDANDCRTQGLRRPIAQRHSR